ncbi:hypothetical protein BRC68_04420 [Halobacteriales archaeon QH_6_64_20]|jgi:hypothetical protein|nr:MAG: hypothetical protein BRC68_04420 [Halobacteriales archaeon QH_6_64_20]
MGTLDWAGVALAVLLGIAYFPIALGEIPSVIGIAFLLAGLGYFGAIVLVLAGYRRSRVYAVGIAYNLLLIALYFVIQQPSLSELAGFGGAVKFGQALFALLLAALVVRRP